jgi:hypothetical protein
MFAVPASAATGDGIGSRIVIIGGVEVPEGKTVDDVFVVRGPVTVDGTVNGTLVSIDGRVTISGTVEEDVVAVNGPLEITDGARIGGDVVSRLTPSIAPGATVGGEVRGVDFNISPGEFYAARFVFWLAASISILILGLILLAFAPRAAEAVQVTFREATGASIGFGAAFFIGLPVVGILALATLVGIPLGLGILLALFPIYAVGYVVSVWLLGRRIIREPGSPYLAFFVGWIVLRALALVPVLGGLLWFVGSVLGLGVLIVSARRASRRVVSTEAPVAMPPPPA